MFSSENYLSTKKFCSDSVEVPKYAYAVIFFLIFKFVWPHLRRMAPQTRECQSQQKPYCQTKKEEIISRRMVSWQENGRYSINPSSGTIQPDSFYPTSVILVFAVAMVVIHGQLLMVILKMEKYNKRDGEKKINVVVFFAIHQGKTEDFYFYGVRVNLLLVPIFQKNVQTSLISKINTNNCKKKM